MRRRVVYYSKFALISCSGLTTGTCSTGKAQEFQESFKTKYEACLYSKKPFLNLLFILPAEDKN
jgi:hypothetical protein